jgi:hypothetical protein
VDTGKERAIEGVSVITAYLCVRYQGNTVLNSEYILFKSAGWDYKTGPD